MRVILHVDVVAMGYHPTGKEIIVIGIELILSKPPLFIRKTIGEVDILENVGTVGTGTS